MAALPDPARQPFDPKELQDDPWSKTPAHTNPPHETAQAWDGSQGQQWETQAWAANDQWAHPVPSQEPQERPQPSAAATSSAGTQYTSSTDQRAQDGGPTLAPLQPSGAVSPAPLYFEPTPATGASTTSAPNSPANPLADAAVSEDLPNAMEQAEPSPMLLFGRFAPGEDSGILVRIAPVFHDPPPVGEEVYLACHGPAAKGTYKYKHYYAHWHRAANKQSEWTMHPVASGRCGRMVFFSAPDPANPETKIYLRFNAAKRGLQSFYLTTSDVVTGATHFIISNDDDRTSIVVAVNPQIRLLHPGKMAIAGAASTDQRSRQEFDGRLASWAYFALLDDDNAIDFQNEHLGTMLFSLKLLAAGEQQDGH